MSDSVRTPKVCLYDTKGNLVLDVITRDKNQYGIALTFFHFKFAEREEDEGIITLAADTVDFLDDTDLIIGAYIKVAWGYMDDMRSPVKMVIIDIIEKYGESGVELTLKLSDTAAALSNGNNPVPIELASMAKTLEQFGDKNLVANSDLFYEAMYPEQARLKRKFQDTREEINALLSDPNVVKTYENIFSVNLGFFMPFGNLIDTNKIANTFTPEWLKKAIPESLTDREVNQWYEYGFDYVHKQKLASDSITLQQLKFSKAYSEEEDIIKRKMGEAIAYSQGGVTRIIQDAIDMVSNIPRQVTCHDGQVLIYSKKRMHDSPPIAEYTYRGGDGKLLEFTYDSNSTYNDDKNALQNVSIDPISGAITSKTHANTIKTLIAKSPQEDANLAFQVRVFNEWLKEYENTKDPAAALKNVAVAYIDIEKTKAELKKTDVKPPLTFPIIISSTPPGSGKAIDSISGNNPKKTPSAAELMNRYQGTFEQAVYAPADDYTPNTPDMEVTGRLNLIYSWVGDYVDNVVNAIKQGSTEIVKATAKLIGDPHLMSGRTVTFNGLSKNRKGKYFITACTHVINPGGYLMMTEMYRLADLPGGTALVYKKTKREKLKDQHKKLKYSSTTIVQ